MTRRPGARPAHLMQVTYSLGVAGSELVARDLALRLHSSALHCSVCAVDFGGPLADDLTHAGIPALVMGRRPGFDWRLVVRFYTLFRRMRPDIVQTHHLGQLVYAGPGARLAGASLVHVEHEYFSLMGARSRRLMASLGRLCQRFVAVGEEVRAFLVKEIGLPADRVRVIANGIDLDAYPCHPPGSRADLGLPDGVRLVGCVARLEVDKAHETLLSAFAAGLAHDRAVHLVLVGDGSLRGSLGERARALGLAERVHFLGVRRDVPTLLPHLDVFVLPSLREGLPVALLEAMAAARPIVATGVGEVSRVVLDGDTGLSVAPGDPDALGRALRRLLDDRALASRLGCAARRHVETHFSLDRTVRGYREVYEELLGRPLAEPVSARPTP